MLWSDALVKTATQHTASNGQKFNTGYTQLGAAANFDDLVKFGDRRQIRWSQIFIKLAFEFGCDVIFMSHSTMWSLVSKLRFINIDLRH